MWEGEGEGEGQAYRGDRPEPQALEMGGKEKNGSTMMLFEREKNALCLNKQISRQQALQVLGGYYIEAVDLSQLLRTQCYFVQMYECFITQLSQ